MDIEKALIAIKATENLNGLNIEGPNRKVSMLLSLREHLIEALGNLEKVESLAFANVGAETHEDADRALVKIHEIAKHTAG